MNELDLREVEELASGAVFCQILDLIYDGIVNLNKVIWNADKSSDFVSNFELLANSLAKVQVQKELNVVLGD